MNENVTENLNENVNDSGLAAESGAETSDQGAQRSHHEEAAAAIWPALERLAGTPIPEPNVSAVRWGATLRWFLGVGIASVLYFGFDRPWLATAVAGVATAIVLLAWLSPFGAHAALQRLLERLGRWVGTAMTWLLLAPVFYLFMTPFGLLARRGRRDALQRALEPSRKSYWQERDDRSAGTNLDRPY